MKYQALLSVNLKNVRFGDQCVQKKYDQLLVTTWGVRWSYK